MKLLVTIAILVVVVSSDVLGQGLGRGKMEEMEYPVDTLVRKSEFWLGANVSGTYAVGFGTLTTQVIGGTAPGASTYSVPLTNGIGYSFGVGPSLEYRPLHSDWGFVLNTSFEMRYSQAESTTPISEDIFAHNALFEQQINALYFSGALGGKYQIGITGAFLMAGLTFALPLNTEAFIWQHEIWDGGAPTNEPGAPQTSIKFKSSVVLKPSVGLQIGVGHDFMVGWFGYRGQMLSPYLVIEGGTPTVSEPTAWNSVNIRLGAIWRAGL